MQEAEKLKQANDLLRYEREKRGWSQAYLAERLNIDPTLISRWETGKSTPSREYQRQLCEIFGKNTIELGFVRSGSSDEAGPARSSAKREQKEEAGEISEKQGIKHNMVDDRAKGTASNEAWDGCFSFGRLKTTTMVLDGDGTEAYLPANIHCHYDPVPAIFFEEVMQVKRQILQEERQKSGKLWNSEKYHLSKIVIGRESFHENMTLSLWFKPRDHYTGLATRRCLDNPAFRAKYIPEDWDWNTPITGFSCSMGVDMTVVSSDGYALLTQRGQNQSVHRGMFNCSVSEALSPLLDRSTTSQAPDLYHCASRGFAEELGLQESVDFSSSDIRFLSFTVDTHYALYGLRGMVKVNKSAEEILQNWHAGVKDKRENSKIFAIPFTPEEIYSFVFSHESFTPGGLVCLYHALVHEFGRRQVNSVIFSPS